jgi:hypothetical protein
MLASAIFTPIFAYLNGRSAESGKYLSNSVKEQIILTEHTIKIINDQLSTEHKIKSINEHLAKEKKDI